MYAWLWRHLPGPRAVRAVTALALFAGLVVLLYGVVFPELEPLLPGEETTVPAPGPTEGR